MSGDQKAMRRAMQQALAGSPSRVGAGALGSSTGVASFMRVTGFGAEKMTAIAASVASSAARTVKSGRANSACGSGRPDFSKCPSGFSAAGSVCSPSSYQGICNRSIDVSMLSAVEAEEFELFCGACFPSA